MYSTKTNQTKQNGAIETVLTKLYSEEMVTKNKPKCEEWIFRVAQCAVFDGSFSGMVQIPTDKGSATNST